MASQDQEQNPDQATQARIQSLLDSQNEDGGWGYTPGGVSWTEPTVLAILALHGHPLLRHATKPAWNFVRSLQRRDGGFRPCKAVDEPHWTTALAVAMHAVRRVDDACFSAGVRWLHMQEGAEGGFFNWVAGKMGRAEVQQDNTLKGWPWLPGTSSWVEPTAHAIIALRLASRLGVNEAALRRIEQGQAMLRDRRCSDGGWNYGNKHAFKTDIGSFPDVTPLALIALDEPVSAPPERLTERGRAWWAIAGADIPFGAEPPTTPPVTPMLAALELLALSGHGQRYFREAKI